jgi:hypothetical protein
MTGPSSGRARCPAHGDAHSNSEALAITEKDGRVLVHCKVGCAQTDVIAALRARDLWPEARPLSIRERTARLVRAIEKQAGMLDAERRWRDDLARDAAAWSSTCVHWRTGEICERMIPPLALARLAALTGPDLGAAVDETARLHRLPPAFVAECVRRYLAGEGAP